jgi:hypothetical protein
VVLGELIDVEGKIRVGGEHRTDAAGVLNVKRPAPTPVDEFIPPASFHEGLIERLEREQHPQPSLGIHMEDQEKSVVLGLDVHLGVVPGGVVPALVQTNPDSLILALDSWGIMGKGAGSNQQQWYDRDGDHREPPDVAR